MRLLTENDIIGAYIKAVYEPEVQADEGSGYQPHDILIELESGLVVSLYQEQAIFDPLKGFGSIWSTNERIKIRPSISAKTTPELRSKIDFLYLFMSATHNFGISLANGYALQIGFASHRNGLDFDKVPESEKAHFKRFSLLPAK
jgi:hypothetical protein